jgi:hypothetical protein
MSINRLQQLEQDCISAEICRVELEKAAFAKPDDAIVAACLEARASEWACKAKYQKALWESMGMIDEEIAA